MSQTTSLLRGNNILLVQRKPPPRGRFWYDVGNMAGAGRERGIEGAKDFLYIWSRLDTAGKEGMLNSWSERLGALRGELESATAPIDSRLLGIRREMDDILVKLARIIEAGPEMREFSSGDMLPGQSRVGALNAQLTPLLERYRLFQELRATTVSEFLNESLPLIREAGKAVSLIRGSLKDSVPTS